MRVLWRKAPLLLLRFPQLFGAVAITAAIMATTAVAGPAFLRSTENASVRKGVEVAGRWTAGLQIGIGTQVADPAPSHIDEVMALRDQAVTALNERLGHLEHVGRASATMGGSEIDGSGPDGTTRVRLVDKAGAEANVTVLERSDHARPGVWIADTTAEQLGVGIGDEIVLRGASEEALAPVAAIYRYLPNDIPRPFWAPLSAFIYRSAGAFVDPPTFILANDDIFPRLVTELEEAPTVRLDIPLQVKGASAADLTEIAREFQEVSDALADPNQPLAQAILEDPHLFGTRIDTSLPGIMNTAQQRVETVTPVVDLLSGAARVLAISVMAAAGFYLVKRRRIEVVLLAARGVGPWQQAIRYGVEGLLAVAAGAVIGSAGGYVLVKMLGPAADLPASVLQQAWPQVVLTVAVGHIFLIVAAAVAVSREERNIADPARPLSADRLIPIAGIAAAGAGVALWRLRERVSAESDEQLRDPLLTILPVLLILAGGIAGSALARIFLPKFGSWLRTRSPSIYLAIRRLTGASVMTLVLIVAVAWALGIAVYGATMSASVSRSADAKAKLFIGSDYAGVTPPSYDLPANLPVPATKVTQIVRVSTSDGRQASLLVIDPGTFADGAFWQDDFADEPLEDLVSELAGADGGSTAAIVSGADETLDIGNSEGDAGLDVVAVTRNFPGQRPDRPLIVVTEEGYDRLQEVAGGALGVPTHAVWAKGEPNAVERSLREAGVTIYSSVDATTVLDTPGLQSLLWVLGLLGAMGAAAAAISIVGLLLYLQARQRAALVAGALTRRMGLGRRAELTSWGAEVGGALLLALVIALATGLPVAEVMRTSMDPRPGLAPSPMLVIPGATISILTVALIGIAVVSALRLRRTIDTADVAEVMRT